MDFEDIASEIHRIITGRKENKHAVQQMAEILGKSQQTVYDCLYGRIKINLDFIKAAVHTAKQTSFVQRTGNRNGEVSFPLNSGCIGL